MVRIGALLLSTPDDLLLTRICSCKIAAASQAAGHMVLDADDRLPLRTLVTDEVF